MKKALILMSILAAACAGARGQVVPAAVAGPAVFDYSFHYSENAEFGEDLGNWQTAVASAALTYRNGNGRLPLSVNYGGGYTFTISGPGYSTGLFQRLYLQQAFIAHKWSLLAGDSLSFLPSAPISGFTGVPGTGEPVTSPAPPTDQSILTVSTRAIENSTNIGFRDKPTFGTTFNAEASYGILRYPDGNGLSMNFDSFGAGVTQRLNARTSLTSSYNYGHFGYPDYDFAFTSNTIYGGFTRVWNRTLSVVVSGGPQWSSSSNSSVVPSSISYAINTAALLHFRRYTGSARYVRGVSGGAGFLFGARTNVVSGELGRTFGRNGQGYSLGVTGSYSRLSGLISNGSTNSLDVGVETSRRFGRYLTGNLSYTVVDQSTTSALPSNALTHALQIVSFGISYSPRATRIVR